MDWFALKNVSAKHGNISDKETGMTLKRQLSLMASVLILLLLTGNLFLTLTKSSRYFEYHLNARAYDAMLWQTVTRLNLSA